MVLPGPCTRRQSAVEQFLGLGAGGLGDVVAADHFGHFLDSVVADDGADGGFGGFADDGFADGEVAVGKGGDLR